MKKFLKHFVVFSVIIFLLGLVLDRVICMGLLKMEDWRFQDYSAMLEGGMENDVLIIGNSRGKSHYNTYLIDSLLKVSSFDIGCGFYPVNIELMKYHLYREHNKKPGIIIFDVNGGTFWSIDNICHQHQSEQFFPLVYDSLMRKELKSVGYGFKELYIPLYRFLGYQQVIKNGLLEAMHIKHYISFPAYKGFRAEDGGWDGTNFDKMEPGYVDFDKYSCSLFEDFLAQCYADSIKVVLVYSPMYYEATSKMLGLDAFKTWLSSFTDKYGFPFLDYMDSLPLSRDTGNFCNASHMNPTATDEFTTILCEDLLSRLDALSQNQRE